MTPLIVHIPFVGGSDAGEELSVPVSELATLPLRWLTVHHEDGRLIRYVYTLTGDAYRFTRAHRIAGL